jgi:taurine dioxygenase
MNRANQTIYSERLSGTLGARIRGLDLCFPVPANVLASLRDALAQHCVLVFPGQSGLSPEQHIAYAASWGPLHIMPSGHLPGHRELIEIAARGGVAPGAGGRDHETSQLARTDIWHSDMSFEEKPPLGSLLLARQIPPVGGDTMFASQYAAFETLSPALQHLLSTLRAIHSGEGYYRLMGLDPDKAPRTAHPVVRTHPRTGRKGLFVNRVWTRHFEGMTVEESKPLLDFLYDHACQPPFTFRHRWSPGDLVFWDNRFVQHYAIRDYGRCDRVMHRATVIGEKVE